MRAGVLLAAGLALGFLAVRAYAAFAPAGAVGAWTPPAAPGDDGGVALGAEAWPGGLSFPWPTSWDLINTGPDHGAQPMDAASNLGAFLAMIRHAEGTAGPDGYRTFFGYRLFPSYSDHPTNLDPTFKVYEKADEFVANGRKDFTSAAGAYQITQTTFNRMKARRVVRDFTPQSQDAIAIELIREAGALADVEAGRFETAVQKVNRVWASLPGAPYPQKKRTLAFVRDAYSQAGGLHA